MQRRGFLKAIGLAAAATLLPRAKSTVTHAQPVYLNVRDFGAVGDGVADDREAFQRAAHECVRIGGGVVYVPAGTYRALPIMADPPPGLRVVFLGTGSPAPGKYSKLVNA